MKHLTKRFSLMAFAETGTLNINDGRNANKNYLLSSDSQSDGLCGVRNRANQLGSHVKKHDTRLLIGRITFLTCGKRDTRHLIGLHRFANVIRPFPSSLLPLFQSESKYEIILMKMTLICMKMELYAELIFI